MKRADRSPSLRLAVTLGVLGVILTAGPAQAANLKVTPSIALEETWDTNIFNTAANEESDFITRATPGLAFALEAERVTFTLSGSVTSEAYADFSDLNDWDATKRAELAAPSIRVARRLSMRAGARYFESNDSWNRTELVLSPIPDLPPTETLVVGRTSVRTYGGSVGATWQATPNVELGIGGGGTKTEYPEDPAAELHGSRTATGNVSAQYSISPRTAVGVTGATSATTHDDGAHTRTYSAGVTGSHAVTESTSVEAGAGVAFLTDTDTAGIETEDESPYGRLAFTYRADAFSATVSGSYDLSGGGSFGQATERTNVSLALTGQIAPKWFWNAGGHYQNEKTTGSDRAREVETTGGSAGVRFAAAEWISFGLSGGTFRQSDRGSAVVGDISRSHVLLGVTLSDTYLLF